ncbi:MAG: hypothetical protein IMF10_03535 [Proteobacteria bacterium]|nr:hypothetical protein [Pseudomonadota bacterium]
MEKYDRLEIRCPRLGGEVTFAYCKQESGNLPCPRIITCWRAYIPVEAYLKETLTQEEWNRCFNRPPKGKVDTIFELVEAAKKRKASPP